LQPSDRISGDQLLMPDTPLDWEKIHCPGVNGLLSIMFALLSWGSLTLSAVEKERWNDAVTDVAWVLEQLYRQPLPQASPAISRKRGPSTRSDTSSVIASRVK
jgi:hypothetical protein